MTFLTAAEIILKSTKRPLTAREITDKAIRRGLIVASSKTPYATMRATLYIALKAHPPKNLQRAFRPGPARAARNSVRWFWSAS